MEYALQKESLATRRNPRSGSGLPNFCSSCLEAFRYCCLLRNLSRHTPSLNWYQILTANIVSTKHQSPLRSMAIGQGFLSTMSTSINDHTLFSKCGRDTSPPALEVKLMLFAVGSPSFHHGPIDGPDSYVMARLRINSQPIGFATIETNYLLLCHSPDSYTTLASSAFRFSTPTFGYIPSVRSWNVFKAWREPSHRSLYNANPVVLFPYGIRYAKPLALNHPKDKESPALTKQSVRKRPSQTFPARNRLQTIVS